MIETGRRTLAEAAALIARRELSPVELTQEMLDRIGEVDPDVRAFVTLLPEQALAQAKEAERELMAGAARGPLHGIPVVLEDLIATAGVPTRAGSRVLENWLPDRDATVASRLEEAGAVLLGKVTTHEFAFDVYTPPTRNPWDLERIAGGSSGGSAPRSRPGSASERSERTPAGRSTSPHRCAASAASSRPTGASAARA